jgi:hypothetical protein
MIAMDTTGIGTGWHYSVVIVEKAEAREFPDMRSPPFIVQQGSPVIPTYRRSLRLYGKSLILSHF